jgi:glycosyltransferase involved in cell wall biosynthesis
MKFDKPTTAFSEANLALREGNYAKAIKLYELCEKKNPLMSSAIKFNVQLALDKFIRGKYECNLKSKTIGLQPLNQLEQDIDDEKHWLSLGNDPHFQVSFDSEFSLQAGWYRIDIIIDSSEEKNLARIYLDYGNGYSENNTLRLPYQKNILTTRVFHTDKPIKNVRFDPKEAKGRFTIKALQWRNIKPEQATRLMVSQLAWQNKNHEYIEESRLLRELNIEAQYNCVELNDLIASKYEGLFEHIAEPIDYKRWIADMESPTIPTGEEAALAVINFNRKPLISIIVPTYNTDEQYLRECIESVISQSYPKWELCIADDASPKPHVKEILEHYQKLDKRIRVVYRSKNGHISQASNSALKLAKGDFVALLDHDDILPDYALFYIAEAINKNPNAQIFYSDEDKLDPQGNRVDPHFKSDWNPDLFYFQNYVSHLGVYKRSLLNRIKGFRQGVEGSQDQDLLLRCLPLVKTDQIVHIPKILYHWRVIEGSTALASGEKSYTTEAGIKALRDYFSKVNPKVEIEAGLVPNTYRTRWPLPIKSPKISLLIPTRDRLNLTEVAVRSIIEKTRYSNFEIIILDNGSVEPETLAFFDQIQLEDSRVTVLRYDHPFNYSAINNFGVAHSSGEIIGLINNDIEVINAEWLCEMVSHAVRPDIGCVGAKLYYPNNTIQHAGVILGIGGVANHSHKNYERNSPGYYARLYGTQNYSAVTAACLLVRRDIYLEVGGLDEKNLTVAFNDVDFCLKVRSAGYRNLWTPHAELYHYESVSRGAEDTPEKINRFTAEVEFMQNKWGSQLLSDPYYNPNLTNILENFSLRAK